MTKKKKSEEVTMYPPITTFANRLKGLLECDPTVKVEFSYDDALITVKTESFIKASAWRRILPESKTFGNETVTIEVEYTNEDITEELINAALCDNTAFSRFYHQYNPMAGLDRNFVYFKGGVIQFKNDNFGSPEALETRVAEDLAREVLPGLGVSYCTERMEEEKEEVKAKEE